jgi:glycerophosphoryl diester phosphodiesterase
MIIAAATLLARPALALEIIAHRGASADAPENTLTAFKLGYQQGADADEMDIHLTKDGIIVAMHDANTGRTSGVTNKILNQTLAQLRRLEVGQWGKWKGQNFAEKVPTLEEVLALVPERKRLFIEIKCGPEVLPELERVLKRAGKKPEQTVLIGFKYETMVQARTVFPKLEVCWLAAQDKEDKTRPTLDELITRAKAARFDGLDLEAAFPIDAAFVQKVHAAGLKLYTWTVDDADVARKHAAAGVDGITTNRPRWLRGQLGVR